MNNSEIVTKCKHDNIDEFMTFIYCEDCKEKNPKSEVSYMELLT